MSQCTQCGDHHDAGDAVCPRTRLPVGNGPVGRRVDRYEILRLIAAGGMGGVYEARHVIMGAPAAVKLLWPHYASQAAIVERFVREARVAASVSHPHVIRVMDFGATPERLVFMVMELLRGRDLETLVRDEVVAPERAVAIVLQVLDALAAVHASGAVHRDIKAANVFLVEPSPTGADFAKLLDFGLSKVKSEASSLTRTGTMMGTPVYIPPEQLQNPKGVDHRADLYAVAVVLYRLVTRQFPFQGRTYEQVLIKSVTEPHTPARHFVPSLPDALVAAIDRGLAKRPEERWSSAAEFARALRG